MCRVRGARDVTGWRVASAVRTSDDGRAADLVVSSAVFLIGFGYFFLFRRLGWFMQDEGVLYYQYLRVYQGQLPYRDFFTGYPPLLYYVHALAFRLFGISINATRVLTAVVNALTAVGLYAVARRVTTRGLAVIPAALFLVMHPAATAVMIFHNSPYPLWYALGFTVWGTWALLRALEAGDRARVAAWLVAAGCFGGWTFLSKQNAGIFFLWGASGFLVSQTAVEGADPRPEPATAYVLRLLYLAIIPLAALVLIHSYLDVAAVAAFVLPAAGLAVLGGRRSSAAAWRERVFRLLCLAAGVLLSVGPWLAYFAYQIGAVELLRRLFFIGASVDLNSYVAFPPPELPTLLILVPAILWALVAWGIGGARQRTARLRLLAVGAVLAACVAIIAQAAVIGRLLHFGYNLWQIYSAASNAVDNLAAWAAVAVLLGGVALVWRQASGGGAEGDPPPQALLCVVWLAACSFMVYYPRMDYAHLVSAAPLVYVAGAGLLPRLRASLVVARGSGRERAAALGFGLACVAVIGFVVLLKTTPKIYSRVMLARAGSGISWVATPQVRLQFARGDLYFPYYLPHSRLYNQAFTDLIHYLDDTVPQGAPIFAFPALPMVYFISGHDNVTRQDYFFGDNVSFPEQLDVIRTLEQERVATVVLANDPTEYFVMKGRDFTRVLDAYLHRRYYLERRIGPYDVMRRFDGQASGG